MLKVKLYCVGRAFNENSCFVDSDFKLSSVSVAMFIILNANSTRKTRHLSGPESGLFTRFNKNWFPPRLKLSSLSWLVILWSCFRHEPVSISLIIHSHFPHCASSGLCCLKKLLDNRSACGGEGGAELPALWLFSSSAVAPWASSGASPVWTGLLHGTLVVLPEYIIYQSINHQLSSRLYQVATRNPCRFT